MITPKDHPLLRTNTGHYKGTAQFERKEHTKLRSEYHSLRHALKFGPCQINEVTKTSVTYTVYPTNHSCTEIPIKGRHGRVRAEKMVYKIEGPTEDMMVLRELIYWHARCDKTVPTQTFPDPARSKPTAFIKFAISEVYTLGSYHLLPAEALALDFYLIDVDTRRLLKEQIKWIDLAAANDLWVDSGKETTFINFLTTECGYDLCFATT